MFYLTLFAILFAVIVFYAPDILGNPDNYTPADPLVTPPDIVPDWYLMPFYAMLRSVPQKLIGVLVLFGAIATLFFVPWLDTSRVRSGRFRPLFKPFFWALAVDCVLLGYCGSQSVDAAWNLGAISLPLIWVARLGTIFYYAYFWLALPIVGLVETPLPIPDSIARSVLSGHAAAATAE
jgi:ubiquinol-cytochrome c reductase cytochrome b subunit